MDGKRGAGMGRDLEHERRTTIIKPYEELFLTLACPVDCPGGMNLLMNFGSGPVSTGPWLLRPSTSIGNQAGLTRLSLVLLKTITSVWKDHVRSVC
jgi:hypothetical protein